MSTRPFSELRLEDPADKREIARRMLAEFWRLDCEQRNRPTDTPPPTWMCLSDADLDALLASLESLRPDDDAAPH